MEPKSEAEAKPNPLTEKLRRVTAPIQAIIGEPLTIDPQDPLNVHGGVNAAGRFSFWGGIEPLGFHANLPAEPTAVIKNLRVPEALRGQRVGSRIVEAWEETLSKQGIKIFAATNIKDKGAVEFWEKQGYEMPQSETPKSIPYYMYKVVENEAPLPA